MARTKVLHGITGPDGTKLELRSLGPSDLDASLKFANRLVKERRSNHDLGIVSLDRPVTRDKERKFLLEVRRGIAARMLVSVAAFAGDELVGNCDVHRRGPDDVHHSGVLGIVVAKEYRGRGLGEAMVKETLRECAELGIWLVELQVFKNNEAARSLYRKVGFKEAGIVPNKILRFGRPIDEVLMYIDLRGINKSPT